MKNVCVGLTTVLAVVFLVACHPAMEADQSPNNVGPVLEQLSDSIVNNFEEMITVWETVRDKEIAETAKPKLKEFTQNFGSLRA